MKTLAHQSASTLGVVLCLLQCAVGELVPVDGFDDGLDDGWQHISRSSSAVGTYDASSGEFVLSTDATLRGPTGISAFWEESTAADFSSGYLRARVRSETPGSNPILLMRVQDPNLDENWKFYGFIGAVNTGMLGIVKFNSASGGFPSLVVQETTPTGIRADEDWFMEAGAVGDELSLKAWKVGDPEPDKPQLIGWDSTFSSGGFAVDVGVAPGGHVQGVRGVFDDISFDVIRPCDFNRDGYCGVDDLRVEDGLYSVGSLTQGSRRMLDRRRFDINGDSLVDMADLDHWLQETAELNGYGSPFSAGDTDLDGDIDFSDFLVLSSNYGNDEQDWSHGDFTGDQSVGFEDFLMLSASFGSSMSKASAVPEPNSLALVLVAIGCTFTVFRRHK